MASLYFAVERFQGYNIQYQNEIKPVPKIGYRKMALSADLGGEALRRTVGQLWCRKDVFMPEGREAEIEGVPLPASLGITRREAFESPLP